MSQGKPLSESEREDLIAYLAEEADAVVTERVQAMLESNPMARREKEMLEASWRALEVLERPSASLEFQSRTASLAVTSAYEAGDAQTSNVNPLWWPAVMVLGLATGWCAVSFVPDRNRQLLKDFPILHRFDELRAAHSFEFLENVSKTGVHNSASSASSEGEKR